MSTITRTFAKDFPNPSPPERGEMIYKIGDLTVYALDGEPTEEELAAHLNPPAEPDRIAKIEAALTDKGVITTKEIDDADPEAKP